MTLEELTAEARRLAEAAEGEWFVEGAEAGAVIEAVALAPALADA